MDAESFERSVGRSGLCVLQVIEKPEWQRMREMQAQIDLLMARTEVEKEEVQTEKLLEKSAETEEGQHADIDS